MNPWLAGHLVFPLHEWMVGRDTLRLSRALEASQWWSPVELAQAQHKKLAALFDHVQANVPFYCDRLRKADAGLADSDPFDTLRCLPLLDKADIRANESAMLWRDAPGGLHRLNTGGSTGQPLNFYVDRRRQACDQAGRIRTHRWFGVHPGDRELWLWGSPVEHGKVDRIKRWRDQLFNHRLVNAFDMSSATMSDYLDEFNRFRPACLFGYPSSIAHLVEHARRTDHPLCTDSLRAVFVTGEVCYPHQRRAIATYFDVPVCDGYGSRDGGFIAHECEEGAMHIMAENLIVEITEDGQPVPPGEEGEIVVTHLDAYAMPFIRYRTGDRGRLRPGRCACGRGLPMMEAIEGRHTDFVHLPNGTSKHALCVIYAMREMPGISRFRITQRADFSLDVKIVPEADAPATLSTDVESALRRVMEDSAEVSVQLVDRIDCDESGKYRHVISYAEQPISQVKAPSEELAHV